MSFASCEASQEGARGQAPFRHPFVADFPARFHTSDFPLRISMRAFCRRCPRRTSSGGARYNCSTKHAWTQCGAYSGSLALPRTPRGPAFARSDLPSSYAQYPRVPDYKRE